MAVNLYDINDGTVYIIDKQNVNSFYELEIYRQVVMIDGITYDVSNTFADLITDIGSGGGGGGGTIPSNP
jgi:hypothetical protein